MVSQLKIKGRIIGFKITIDQKFLVFRTPIITQGSGKYIKAYEGYFLIRIRRNQDQNQDQNQDRELTILNLPISENLRWELIGKKSNYIDLYIPLQQGDIPLISKKNIAILTLNRNENQHWEFKEIKIILGEL